MDDTGLWLPYPQQLQARIDKNLTKVQGTITLMNQ